MAESSPTTTPEQSVEDAVEKAMAEALAPPSAKVRPFAAPATRAVSQPELSLGDQLAKLDEISRQLKDKARREKLKLVRDYETRVTDVRMDYEQRIQNLIMKMETDRNQELRQLSDEFFTKVKEIEFLLDRMS